MRFAAGGFDVEAQCAQVLFNAAAQLLAVLQGAWGVKGDLTGLGFDLRTEYVNQIRQQLAQVPGQRADTLGLGSVSGVIMQRVAVVFDHAAAA